MENQLISLHEPIERTNYMPNLRILVVLILGLGVSNITTGQTITTVAGSGVQGYGGDGNDATSARLYNPSGVVVDALGNVYIADYYNSCIRKVNTSGKISTIAGTGNMYGESGDGGPANAALLGYPSGLAIDAGGNLFIADAGKKNVRKITPSGVISLFAGGGSSLSLGDGGPATAAYLDGPTSVAIDTAGNVYIADQGGNRIRKVNKADTISTFAGTGVPDYKGDGGPATAAAFRSPNGVATDKKGNVYIADSYNNCVRKVSHSGIISTIAGVGFFAGYSGDGGPATSALLSTPLGLVVDTSGNVYVADAAYRVRRITTWGKINTVAGTSIKGYNGDGIPATSGELNNPAGVALDANNNLYIADQLNNLVRMVTINTTAAPLLPGAANTSLTVYPNPSNGSFKISLYAAESGAAQIVITDMLGKTVKEFTMPLSAGAKREAAVDLHVPEGIYFVSALIGSGCITQQIVVK